MAFPSVANIINNPGELKQLFGLIPTTIGDVIVDCLPSFSDSMDADITGHPIETGFEITDARTIRPQQITLECIFTDPDYSGGNIARSALAGTLSSQMNSTWRDKRERIIEIFKNSEIVDVNTPDGSFDSMLILSIKPERTPQTMNAWFATIELRHVKIVSSEIINVSAAEIPGKVETAAQKTAKKRKSAVKPKATQQGQAATQSQSSILNDLASAVGLI